MYLWRLRAACLPVPERCKDDSVSFRSVKLQKFRYRGIELCGLSRSPALLTHVQPSGLKRSKSAFLLVRHRPADEYFRGLIESERFI